MVARFFFAHFQFLARRKARTEKVGHESNRSKSSKRSRVREVDFMRVEDASTRDSLSPFEMEVKNRIAGERPLEKWTEEVKERQAKSGLALAFKGKLRKLLSKEGVLTKRQRDIYELSYVQKLSDPEIAKRLGVARVTVRTLRCALKEALKRAVRKERDLKGFHRKVKQIHLSRTQKKIWRMYQKEGLPVVKIARRLGKSFQTVYWVLQNLLKKISRRETLNKCEHPRQKCPIP